MMFVSPCLAVGILGFACEWPELFLAIVLFIIGRIAVRIFE